MVADLLLGRISHSRASSEGASLGATIGVVVPVLSLAGRSDEPGTIFYRIFTDPIGRILDVSELGPYASKKLRIATQIRDGTCAFSTCSRPASESDLDHVDPLPVEPQQDGITAICVDGIIASRLTGPLRRWSAAAIPGT